ncbi:MAG TPA: MFS transporter [Chitinophagaceae bacterium]|nr:MFS transporter [Chitinophagaceae bacterium]
MKRNYYLVGLILLSFFVISFLTNIIGPLIPDIIKEFHLSLVLVAVLPFAFFIAYGVMSIPSGMLVEKYKEKRIMIAGFFLGFAGSLLLALDPNYLTAVISLFVIGCGMAMLQVVINPLLRISGGEEHFAFNSVLGQLVFGLASFISPLVYSYLVTHLKIQSGHGIIFSTLLRIVPPQLPWISLYWLFTLISLVMIGIVICSKFPRVELKKEEQVGPMKTHLGLLRNRVVILFFVGLFCYVGTEQGTANWISQFLHTYHGYDPQTTGAGAVSYFWGLMTLGGILGLILLKFMDSRRVLISFTLLALIALSAALFGSAKVSLWAFPIVGFFASVMYPIIFSLALNSVSEHHGSFSGILLTGVIGGAVVTLLIGWISNHLGLRTGMGLLYLTLGYILLIGFWARPLIVNKTISLGRTEDIT